MSSRGYSLNRRQHNRVANDSGAVELFLSTTTWRIGTSSRVEDGESWRIISKLST